MALKPDMSNELRHMVREVLRDVMASRGQQGAAAVEPVQIGNDQELAAFVARLIEPSTLERIRSGKLRFTLNAGTATPLPASPAHELTGVITEQKINKLSGSGALILGAGAVLTPLARDRARKLGLRIERRR